jgi:urea transport system ATP-binding protein
MGFVRQFAQRVTVLHLGKILSQGSMEMVSSDQQVIRAYLGRSRTRPGDAVDADPGMPQAGSRREQNDHSVK